MEQKELTLLEFQKRFKTEADCVRALMTLRWPRGFVCPNCGHDDGYPTLASIYGISGVSLAQSIAGLVTLNAGGA